MKTGSYEKPFTIAAMADHFEWRFRTQAADIFQPGAVPRVWTDPRSGMPAVQFAYSGPAVSPADDDPTVGMGGVLNTSRWITPGKAPRGRREIVLPPQRTPKYEAILPQIVEMAEAGSGVDLISRTLGIGAEVVRDALRLHRTGKQPPGRVDGRRRQNRTTGKPFVPKYRQIAAEVDRRRKSGEGFGKLARELKVSRPTIFRAYDYANRDESTCCDTAPGRPSRWNGSP